MMQIPDAAVLAALNAYCDCDSHDELDPMRDALTAALPYLQLGFEAKLFSATDAAHHHREKNKKLRKRNRALLTALREVVASKTLHDANFIANIAIAGWEDDELIHKARNVTSLATKPVDVAAVRRQAFEEAARKAEELLIYADTTSTADKVIPAAIRALSAEPASRAALAQGGGDE